MTNKTEKTALLVERFFSKSSKIDLSNIERYEYSESMKFENLTNHEIERAINDVVNNKISENDEIEYRIIALLIKITNLLNILRQLFQISVDHDYCSLHFRRSITVCLRKFDKSDYSVSKSYRSIALLFTIKKTLKSMLINRLI